MRECSHSFPSAIIILTLVYFSSSRPENLTRPYTIGTTFPNRTLDDDFATIQGSGLVNSVVVQRWV
jgi:UBX domain-containing protein 1